MFFAISGTFLIIVGACFNSKEFIISGIAFLALDISLEIANLKEQIYHVGKAIRDAIKELKEGNIAHGEEDGTNNT